MLKKKNENVQMLVFAVVLSVFLSVGVTYTVVKGKPTGDKTVVAMIGKTEVTKDQLYELMVESQGASTLDSYVSELVVEKELADRKIVADKAEVDKEYNLLIEEYGSETALNAQMEASKLTKEQLLANIERYLKMQVIYDEIVEVTDEEIEDYFDKNQEALKTPARVEASHILVDDETLARTLHQRIIEGEKFEDLAKEYSTDEGTKNAGGALGFFTADEMVKEFSDVAFATEKGAVSHPVKSSYGYHIIYVTDKEEEKEATLDEETKKKIKLTIQDKALSTEYGVWLDEMYEKHEVEILL